MRGKDPYVIYYVTLLLTYTLGVEIDIHPVKIMSVYVFV